jgi:hypothetical protein
MMATMKMKWVRDDGGREAAGFKGTAGDCVTRAIAIAGKLPYLMVYDELNVASVPLRKRGKNSSARNGVRRSVIRAYFKLHGWRWVPTMGIGTGCKFHLRPDELPKGRLVVNCSRHLTAVIDGVCHDTHDPSRGGTRCVYGFWHKPIDHAAVCDWRMATNRKAVL